MTSKTNCRGFTLAEVTIGILIAAVVTLGVFRIFQTTSDSFDRGTENIDGQQNARAALNWMARELRGAKGFTLVDADEVTFLSDVNVNNQIRTFRLDVDDRDGDGDTSELLLIRNPDDDGTIGVFTDEIAVGIDSLAFVYRNGVGTATTSRAAVQEVEVLVFARGHRLGREGGEARHDGRKIGMATRVSCRNLGKSVPTLGDVLPPLPPTGLVATMGCGTATVSWNANVETDLSGYYLAYDRNSGGSPYGGTDADQGPSPIFVGSATSYTLTGLDLVSTYYFNLQAVDAADNVGMWGTEVSGVPADPYPPGTPVNVVGRVVENDEIYLEWSPSTDWDISVYRVTWRGDDDPTIVNSQETQQAFISIPNLNPNVTYTCVVTAIDGCRNESSPSAPITITLVPCVDDVTFPAIPQTVAVVPGDRFIRLTWDRVADTDVVGYQVYYESASGYGSTMLVGNVNTFTVHGLENGVRYEFQVAAMDGCGHVGGFSGLQGATPVACGGNTAPPASPLNVTAADTGTGDQVSLSWTRSREGGVLGYIVYWGSASGAYDHSVDVGNVIFWNISALTAGAPTYFAVSAYDVCGGESAHSSEATAIPTWGCVCPPTAVTTAPGPFAIVAGTVPWTVNATACSTASVTYVEFRIDGATRHVDYSAPYAYGDFGLGWETAFEADGQHALVAAVVDNNGCITSDTSNVYVDNSASGIPCLGIDEGATGVVGGAYGEAISIDVNNLSIVETYKLGGVILEWALEGGMAPTAILFDAIPSWTTPWFPGASGDTLMFAEPLVVPPGSMTNMTVSFWDNPSTAVPSIPFATAGLQVTFLGTPSASCGPYPITVAVPVCDPGVSITSVTSSNAYDVFGPPEVGDTYYTDRSYALTSVPEVLDGATLLRTPNNDKNAGGSHRLILSFTKAVTVYIAYDPRGTPPNWIKNNYVNTGTTIGVTDSGTSTLGLWRRDLGAGARTFKGNKAKGWSGGVGTNYIIFVKCQEEVGI